MYSIGIVTESGEILELDRVANRIGLARRAEELSRAHRSPVVIVPAGAIIGTTWARGLKRSARHKTKEEIRNGA